MKIFNCLGFGYLEDVGGYLELFGSGYPEDDGGYIKLFRVWIS